MTWEIMRDIIELVGFGIALDKKTGGEPLCLKSTTTHISSGNGAPIKD